MVVFLDNWDKIDNYLRVNLFRRYNIKKIGRNTNYMFNFVSVEWFIKSYCQSSSFMFGALATMSVLLVISKNTCY